MLLLLVGNDLSWYADLLTGAPTCFVAVAQVQILPLVGTWATSTLDG